MFDPRDLAISLSLPLAVAPAYGELDALPTGVKRLILGRNGLFLEARTDALHACLMIDPVSSPLPFGEVQSFIRFSRGPCPKALITEALRAAVNAHPCETALAVITDAADGYCIEQVPIEQATSGSVRYTDTLDDDRLVIDIHSHGAFPPIFSATDDESDRSRRGPYVAMVIGHCASPEEARIALRFVCSPFLLPMSSDLHRHLFR